MPTLGNLANYPDPSADDLQRASGAKYDSVAEAAIPPKSIWEKAIDFLLGRTKAGQYFHTVAGAIIGIATGVNIDPILEVAHQPLIQYGVPMDFDWINILFLAVGSGIGMLTKRGVIKGVLADFSAHFEQIIDKAREGRQAASPKGKQYTNAELEAIFQEVEDTALFGYKKLVRGWLAKQFGIRKRNQ